MTNGLRSGGNVNGRIVKQGAGTLIFAGDPSVILNTFVISQGAAIFETNISTVAVLNVAQGAIISLQNTAVQDVAISTLYVTDDFTLNGKLAIDVDFNNLTADQIFLTDAFSVSNSTLSINLIDRGSSGTITIINITNVPAAADISTFYAPRGYILRIENNNVVLNALDGAWNIFAKAFEDADGGEPVKLVQNTYAKDEILPPLDIVDEPPTNESHSLAVDSLTVNGQGFILDAQNPQDKDLGLNLDDISVTFKDITFRNFTGDTGVISAKNSQITFAGNIGFINNSNDISLDGASVQFDGVVFTNGLNLKGSGEIKKVGAGTAIFRGDRPANNGAQMKGGSNFNYALSSEGAGTNIENIFTIEGGVVVFESSVSRVSVINVKEGAQVSLKDGNAGGALYVGQLNLEPNTQLWFDIDFTNSVGDILVSTNAIVFGEGITLNINNVSKNLFVKNSIEIIFAGEEINYGNIIYDDTKYYLDFGSTNNILSITNYPLLPIDFETLTKNQQVVLDIINQEAQMLEFFKDIGTVSIQKNILDSLSGVFYANIFAQSVDSNAPILFSQIRQMPQRKLWTNINYYGLEFNNEKQTLGAFNEQGFGINLGGDILAGANFRSGLFADIKSKNLKQQRNTASVLDLGIGVYGDIKIKGLNFIALLGVKEVKADVVRQVKFDRIYNPEGKVSLMGYNAAAKLNYMFNLGKENSQTAIGPFIMGEGGWINTKEITEENGGFANLHFAPQTLSRTIARYGLEFKTQTDSYQFFLEGFAGQNISGMQRVKTNFVSGNDIVFELESDDLGDLFYGGKLGLSFNATESLAFGVMTNFELNDNYKNYAAGINMQYQFWPLRRRVNPEEVPVVLNEPEAPAAAPVIVEAPLPEPATRQAVVEPVPAAPQAVVEPPQPAAQAVVEPQPETKVEVSAPEVVPFIVQQPQIPALETRIVEGGRDITNQKKPLPGVYTVVIAHFAFNEWTLTEESKRRIADEARRIQEYDYKKLILIGYTDSVGGNSPANDLISFRRADSVYREFVNNGIEPHKIEYWGRGARNPVAPNNTPANRAKNRRV
ncbi:MAG: autotransporter domain-containing protein, partial [Elusimicrobiota bacterium]|nr:autotransporter domain-containing protein [Elusimicrobiota bacterium]